MSITSLKADAYTDYIDNAIKNYEPDLSLFHDYIAIQNEITIGVINAGLDIHSGAMAVGAIDFNPDHKGSSIGFGYGTGYTFGDYRAHAGAFGYQYAWSYREVDVSLNVKSWTGKNKAYGVGFGGVIGF